MQLSNPDPPPQKPAETPSTPVVKRDALLEFEPEATHVLKGDGRPVPFLHEVHQKGPVPSAPGREPVHRPPHASPVAPRQSRVNSTRALLGTRVRSLWLILWGAAGGALVMMVTLWFATTPAAPPSADVPTLSPIPVSPSSPTSLDPPVVKQVTSDPLGLEPPAAPVATPRPEERSAPATQQAKPSAAAVRRQDAPRVEQMDTQMTRLTGPTPAAPPTPPRPATTPAPKKFVGTLVIGSLPEQARVFVNGQPVGVTPLVLLDVPVGSRVVRLEADDHVSWSSNVRIVANQQTTVNASLTRLP